MVVEKLKNNIEGKLVDVFISLVVATFVFMIAPIDKDLMFIYIPFVVFPMVLYVFFKPGFGIKFFKIFICVLFLLIIFSSYFKIYLADNKYFVHCKNDNVFGDCFVISKVEIAGSKYYFIPVSDLMQSTKSLILKSIVGEDYYNSRLIEREEYGEDYFITPPSEKMFAEMKRSEGTGSGFHANIELSQNQYFISPRQLSLPLLIDFSLHSTGNKIISHLLSRSDNLGEWKRGALSIGKLSIAKSKIDLKYPLSTHQSTGYIFSIKGDINKLQTWKQIIELENMYKAMLANNIEMVNYLLNNRKYVDKFSSLELFYDSLEITLACNKNVGFGYDLICLERIKLLVSKLSEKNSFTFKELSVSELVSLDLLRQAVSVSGVNEVVDEDLELLDENIIFKRIDYLGYKKKYFSRRLSMYRSIVDFFPKKLISSEVISIDPKDEEKISQGFVTSFSATPEELNLLYDSYASFWGKYYRDEEKDVVAIMASLPYDNFEEIVDRLDAECDGNCSASFLDLYKSIPKPFESLTQGKLFSLYYPALRSLANLYEVDVVKKMDSREVYDLMIYLGEQFKLHKSLVLKKQYILTKISPKYLGFFEEISDSNIFFSRYPDESELIGDYFKLFSEKPQFSKDDFFMGLGALLDGSELAYDFKGCMNFLDSDVLGNLRDRNFSIYEYLYGSRFSNAQIKKCANLVSIEDVGEDISLLVDPLFRMLSSFYELDSQSYSDFYRIFLEENEVDIKKVLSVSFSKPSESHLSDFRTFRILIHKLIYSLMIIDENFKENELKTGKKLKSIVCDSVSEELWWELNGFNSSSSWRDASVLINLIPIVNLCETKGEMLTSIVESDVPSGLLKVYLDMQEPWYFIPDRQGEVVQNFMKKILEGDANEVEIEVFVRLMTIDVDKNKDWFILANVGEASIYSFVDFIKSNPNLALSFLGEIDADRNYDLFQSKYESYDVLRVAQSIRIIDPGFALNVLREKTDVTRNLVEICSIYLQLKEIHRTLSCIEDVLLRYEILSGDSVVSIVDSLYKIGAISRVSGDVDMLERTSFLLVETSRFLDTKYEARDELYRKMLYAYFDYCNFAKNYSLSDGQLECSEYLRRRIELLRDNFKDADNYRYFDDLFKDQFQVL